MKLSVISDLHLEFCEIGTQLPGGDILLMAGDMFSAAHFASHRTDADARGARKRAELFCKKQLKKYARVFYVMGNHEHYSGVFEETAPLLRAFLAEHAPHVTLLDNETAEIGGVTIIGSTLWAPCGIGNPTEEFLIRRRMRDFSAIKTNRLPIPDGWKFWNGSRAFQPRDAYDEHQKARRFLSEAIKTSGPTILFTHHAPSLQSAYGAEHGSEELDAAYCSNLVDFFQQQPNIKLAVHGHTHHAEHYRIGQTLVVSNPRGYFPYERRSKDFDPGAEDIELEDLLKDKH